MKYKLFLTSLNIIILITANILFFQYYQTPHMSSKNSAGGDGAIIDSDSSIKAHSSVKTEVAAYELTYL